MELILIRINEQKNMTEQRIKEIWGQDVNLLFKGSEPFTEIEKDVPAGVILTNKEGKINCYICKKWFDSLGTHLRKHNLTAREYKIKYSLILQILL